MISVPNVCHNYTANPEQEILHHIQNKIIYYYFVKKRTSIELSASSFFT